MFFVINFTEFWKKYIQHIRLLVGHSIDTISNRWTTSPVLGDPMLRYHHWIWATSWSVSVGCTFVPPKKLGGGGCTVPCFIEESQLIPRCFLKGSWWTLFWMKRFIDQWKVTARLYIYIYIYMNLLWRWSKQDVACWNTMILILTHLQNHKQLM